MKTLATIIYWALWLLAWTIRIVAPIAFLGAVIWATVELGWKFLAAICLLGVPGVIVILLVRLFGWAAERKDE